MVKNIKTDNPAMAGTGRGRPNFAKPFLYAAVAAVVVFGAVVFTAKYRMCRGIDGTYSGVVPCADCSGIRTTLDISCDEYSLKLEYLDKPSVPFTETGKVVRTASDEIKLEGQYPVYYRVLRDGLLQLDMEMNPIHSEFNYLLLKE
ncbi:MAG: copper resistance protein NlpE [Rickettsiales bacterium]|jgi:copper homeostasis protein (lipoprotein)|nr:copper resistance protein NlpE [Rickettsiales bacterium]